MIKIKPDKICRTLCSRCIGLMFSRKKTIVLEFKTERTISLHTIFVFYPISLVFLDKNKKVVEIKKNILPFKTYTSKTKAKYVIELPKDINLKIGNTVTFI